ncbi:hypothetical protein GCM10023219_20630 [Stakelama sediminis]|uniref:RNA polymerase sigma-70 factor (ECF subfamily) n=1 Tax=Stakelama sediminis TaxID=463200 RepID=A0A840Z2G5_9SPHN|nr:RNA polymerase sigma factor [Stakelama sediminis]MBB5719930.1 RNA polymerase sigma-70 factor (ECF subfamily) [Stakelama sediminis]
MRLKLLRGLGGRAVAAGVGDPLPSAGGATGDDPELERLYQSQASRLHRYFVQQAGADEAQDLVHESFERLARKGKGFLRSLDCPEAYLTRIATNLVRDRARREDRRSADAHVPAHDVPLAGADPFRQLEARDMVQRLETAMMRLRPTTREIFMACRLDGYSYAEVAEHVGISVRAVRKHMGRAIAEIDRAMSDDA